MYLYYDQLKDKKLVAVVSEEMIASLGDNYVIADLPKEEGLGNLCINDKDEPYYDGEPQTDTERLEIENKKLKEQLEKTQHAQSMAEMGMWELYEKVTNLQAQIESK